MFILLNNKMNLKFLPFCACYLLTFVAKVNSGGPQLQISEWFKSLNVSESKTCDKRSTFNFDESNILIDNVPCKPKKSGVTDLFQFYDVDFIKDQTGEDGYLKGRGNLFIFKKNAAKEK